MVCVAFAMVAGESHIIVCYGISRYIISWYIMGACIRLGRGRIGLCMFIISPQVDSFLLRVGREEP